MTDSTPETWEQVIARLGLDPNHVQTPGLVAHELTRNRAKALAAAEERRWARLDARLVALERFVVDVATHTAPIGTPASAEVAANWAANYGVPVWAPSEAQKHAELTRVAREAQSHALRQEAQDELDRRKSDQGDKS